MKGRSVGQYRGLACESALPIMEETENMWIWVTLFMSVYMHKSLRCNVNYCVVLKKI
ncbi:MAG: hypothetical protein JWR26_2195 [Pedosphaera sp.]|nr:hypothetical protein [Pedosphaera sp.]